ncbi:glycosyltransferase [Uliginosibacterium sp. H1]|uniref:glycosyltransferase n=1 Tax=Uliginosibacterium sp. H1 TaxID=3114757 RepID=UPI002E17DB4F|nr:glycosyltransferase [Uliginosibacterium sp. H1]
MSGPAKKLLVVVASLGNGGAEHALLNLLSRLDRGAFSPAVLCLGGEGAMAARYRTAGIPVRALGMRPGRWPLGQLSAARAAMREMAPDLLLGWMYHGNLAAAVLAGALPRSPKLPLAWAIRATPDHAHSHSLFTGGVIQASRLFLRKVDLILNVSSRSAALMQSRYGYPAARTVVLPNGVDTARFAPQALARAVVRAELGLSPATPLFGMVARWHPVKNHALFVRAAARCVQAIPAAQFVLVGEGCETANFDLLDLLDAAGMRDRFHLVGAQRDVERWNAAFDVAVLSSSSEAFPNVLVEAMSCGTPVVSTDVGDAREIVADTGFVVSVDDEVAMGTAMATALAERSTRGAAARARVLERYDLTQQAARFADILARLGTPAAPTNG